MNERIKELAKQAGAAYGDGYDFYLLEDHIEKFAELIVRECISAVRQNYVDRGTTEAVIAIEKHFGVEE